MRILLSTIGSRGDVQPLVALALRLEALGQDVLLCLPPDFREWIEALGLAMTPIGPEVRGTAKAQSPVILTAEQRRQMIEGTVATQFAAINAAARGCDVIVGATALQVAAPSIAESLGIPYVFAAYCPVVLPSVHHAPPLLRARGDVAPSMTDNRELWRRDAEQWNVAWRALINAQRKTLGLSEIDDARRYVLTDRPWLAADPTLAPWPDPDATFQTGAWLVDDDRPLDAELLEFLDAGDPPVYFGFGSNRAPESLSRTMIESARAVGRRAIVLRGWADLSLIDGAPDCLAIGEVNHHALFSRVAAVVHHGGAGTTTAAARAGAPQVVVPQHYDQPYWADRVEQLDIGVDHRHSDPTTDSLAHALEQTLTPRGAARARAVASQVRIDGADVAARRLLHVA